MTTDQLSAKLAEVLEYLRQTDSHATEERECQQDDIDSLLARVADLENRLAAIE